MKILKLLSLVALTTLLSFTMVSCNDDDDESGTLQIDPSSLEFGYNETASKEVTVQTNAGNFTYDFKVESDSEWVEITPGNGKISVSVKLNEEDKQRVSEVLISARNAPTRTLTITQDAYGKPYLDAEDKSANFGAEEELTVRISLSTNIAADDISVINSLGWLDASVSGSVLTLVAEENPGDERSGTVTLRADEVEDLVINVKQDAIAPYLEPETDEANFGSDEDLEVTIELDTNIADNDITIVNNLGWLKVTLTNSVLKLVAEENPGAGRSGTVTLRATGVEDVDIAIEQAAFNPYINVEAGDLDINFAVEGELEGQEVIATVELDTNLTDGSITVVNENEWLEVTLSDGVLTFTAEANYKAPRQGTVTLRSAGVTDVVFNVSQEGFETHFLEGDWLLEGWVSGGSLSGMSYRETVTISRQSTTRFLVKNFMLVDAGEMTMDASLILTVDGEDIFIEHGRMTGEETMIGYVPNVGFVYADLLNYIQLLTADFNNVLPEDGFLLALTVENQNKITFPTDYTYNGTYYPMIDIGLGYQSGDNVGNLFTLRNTGTTITTMTKQ